jgi:oligopeptidase A
MDNPLSSNPHPHRLPRFSDIEPSHVESALDEKLSAWRKGMTAALDEGGLGGWPLVAAEVAWSEALSRAWSPVSHLNSVADNEALRAAYNDGLQKLTEHDNWRAQNEALYRAYQSLKESGEWHSLSAVQRRIVNLELRDFELSGVALPPEQKAVYRELRLKLSKLGTTFQENLLDATRGWTLHLEDEQRLAGIPQAERKLLQEIARQHDRPGWMIDLNAPAFHAVMTYAEDRGLRREVYEAYVTRASNQGPNAGRWDNQPVIEELLALKHRLANLLGFANYAEYALARRMADSPQAVLEFLEALAARAHPAAVRQMKDLETFAAASGAAIPLQAWDVGFWSERYRQAELRLSDEELKPYFALEPMLQALEHTANALFGLRFVADNAVETWHPDVRFFWLQDREGQPFAGIYMDLFARQDKRGGAWMDVCLSRLGGDQPQRPVAYLTCNFSPPVGEQPCLMTHNDVETLFHEFGHCLHHLLTEIDWPQINGISNVEWDAVELPSQLLENWCWTDQVLASYARHYQTGEPMPEALKMRLLRSRSFQGALFLVRQLEYALCDFRLHLEYDPEHPVNPQDLLREIRADLAVVPVPEWNRFLNGFAHIFGGGYAAGYYSYLWAEQLSADAWGRFEEQGALDARTGEALRREILAVGASRPAMDSFVAFRGRQPSPDPLLKMYGLE